MGAISASPKGIIRKGLADQIYERIKKLILNGSLKGGQRIPEETLAEEFKVSDDLINDFDIVITGL